MSDHRRDRRHQPQEPFIDAALATVAAQTWPHWRLILVDDGGPDPEALEAAASHLEEARVIHRPHAGVSAARNAGLAAGTGQLVAFLDDDDLWDPRRLGGTGHRIASGFRGGGRLLRRLLHRRGWTHLRDGVDAEHVARERMIDGSVPAPRIVSLLVTRDTCLRVGGFDESLVLAEDNDFVLRVLQQGPLTAVPEKLVGYRRHGGNASDEVLTESRRATDRLLAKQIDAARRRGDAATAALLRSHRQRHHRRAANKSAAVLWLSLRRRDGRAFVDELSWAIRHTPWFTAAAVVRRTCRVARRRRRSR